MRSALARAAIRRGSSTMIFLVPTHGASSSANGTRVVLPAPGGATSTAALPPASVRASSSSTASIGSGASKLRGKLSPPPHARLVPGIHVFLEYAENKTWMAVTSTAMTEKPLRTSSNRPASDALIDKAECRHLFRAVDVAEVDHHGMLQFALQAIEVQGAILHPLRHDHHGV